MDKNNTELKQLPLALVHGDSVLERPHDLFIPPDALEVFLDSFEGPLDFLLYLIRKQKFDIVNLPIMEITIQYTKYVEVMKESNLELASDYLVMAAMLAEIKSRMLLPVLRNSIEEDADPRAELVRQLIEYERFKQAAIDLDCMPRLERDLHSGTVGVDENCIPDTLPPEVSLKDIASALLDVLSRADNFQKHHIKREHLSTRDRMTKILERLSESKEFVEFSEFFSPQEGKEGIVVTFLAILELVKEKFLDLMQSGPFTTIYIKRHIDVTLDMERVLQ